MAKHYPTHKTDVAARIRILRLDEAQHFWDFRGNARIKEYSHDKNGFWDFAYEADMGSNGVMYVIDEAGVVGFRAAGWAQKESSGTTRGAACLFYIDQHRKLGDAVYFSLFGTNPHGIAKPLRDAAGEYIQLRNGKQRKMGAFKARGVFTAWHYYQEPSPTVEFFAKLDFPFDLELMDCYDTAAGMGIQGSTADKGASVKGIPVMWLWPMAIGLVSLIGIIPMLGGRLLGHTVEKQAVKQTASLQNNIPGRVSNKPTGPVLDQTLTISGVMETEVPQKADGFEIVGKMVKYVELIMSDGEHYSSEEYEIAKTSPNTYTINGTRYVVKLGVKDDQKENSTAPSFEQQVRAHVSHS